MKDSSVAKRSTNHEPLKVRSLAISKGWWRIL